MACETNWTSDKVRETFIDFFEKKKGHTFVPSSPAVPHDDPTLLFTNAGMNQYKPIFLGKVEPSSPLAKLSRATNSQKCIRAGGKHNDLDDVGKDVYHHTFFEMLGNWSFGDYFKEETIAWAWELLTKVFKLPEDRLYATYFSGAEAQGLEPDNEAKNFWLKYLPESRVLPFDMKDNFWEMGETGPCGPCTEIHFDRIGGRDAAHLVNMDDPDVLEIWNLVFIQFNRESATKLKKLPACHVDTGMGFERVTSILQNKRSNYDTDVFQYLFDHIEREFNAPKYQGRVGDEDTDTVDMAYRVVADHVRTLSIAIADGALPSNTGRGYVLRRIVRRAARYGRQFLNTTTGFLSGMVPVVCQKMGGSFPELLKRQEEIVSVILEEERQFGLTLDLGLKQFLKIAAGLKGNVVPGKDAHKLYDTFGFPLDLTQLMAEERDLEVDVKGYYEAMDLAKARSSKKAKGVEQLQLKVEETDALYRMGCPPTNDKAKYLWSVSKAAGPALPCRVVAVWDGNSFLRSATAGETSTVGLVLDRTSYYSEAGGQIADRGTITAGADASDGQTPDGDEPWKYWEIDVLDVQKFGSFVLHIGTLVNGTVVANSPAVCQVDYGLRVPVASNHTATHVLNWSLLKNLDQSEVLQKGSFVDSEKLRFDFNHNGPVPLDKIEKVEEDFVSAISSNLRIYSQEVPQQAALQISSLRAVFGETYPDVVRVVSVGMPIREILADPKNTDWANYSVEFCGGTHVGNTSIFEDFVVLDEGGISKGVRRITATTRSTARKANKKAEVLSTRATQLGVIKDPNTLQEEVAKLRQEIENEPLLPLRTRRRLEDQLGTLKKKALKTSKASGGSIDDVIASLVEEATENNSPVIVAEVPTGANGKQLKQCLDKLEKKIKGKAVFLFGLDANKNKFNAIASVPQSLSGDFSAAKWAKDTLSPLGAKGGGQPNRANGSGSDNAIVPEAIKKAKEIALSALK